VTEFADFDRLFALFVLAMLETYRTAPTNNADLSRKIQRISYLDL